MMPVFYTVGGAILYCATPPTLLLGQMLPGFYMRLVREPLLSYPPLHYCWGRCCPFSIRLVREPLLSYPPLHYCLGGCCPFSYGWLRDPLLRYPPPTLLLGQMPPVFYTVGVLGDPSLCFPPTLHPG